MAGRRLLAACLLPLIWAEKAPVEDLEFASVYCTGQRKSKDAIVYLGQKTHSTYDTTHKNTLNASMESLRTNMKNIAESDVIIWHEGDLTPQDATALDGATNVRMCLLTKETGWGMPPWLRVVPTSKFSAGYRFMIRFYAVTIWKTLSRLGYEWVMRMDDDSFIHSTVPYNIFDDMRSRNLLYGYRMLSRECPSIFGEFVEGFVKNSKAPTVLSHRRLENSTIRRRLSEESSDPFGDVRLDDESKRIIKFCGTWPRHCRRESQRLKLGAALTKYHELKDTMTTTTTTSTTTTTTVEDKYIGAVTQHQQHQHVSQHQSYRRPQSWYCNGPGRLGYYNNWFVTKISWWIEHPTAARMIETFDRSNLIFTRRLNDLIFQTAAIQLYMPANQRKRYTDFTYQHHTVSGGIVTFGGIETGYRDERANEHLEAYLAKHVPGQKMESDVIETCEVQETVGAPFQRIHYVSPARISRRRDNTVEHFHAGKHAPPALFESPYCEPDEKMPLW